MSDKALPEYQMTQEDWEAMHWCVTYMRLICTQGIAQTKRQMHKARSEAVRA